MNTGMPSRASFKRIAKIPYLIIEALIMDVSQDANDIWKLLKYTSIDALSENNLTKDEKKAMIWGADKNNSSSEVDFNVFVKILVPNALNDDSEQTQLRIYRYGNDPITTTKVKLPYKFDILVNEKSSTIYDYDGRIMDKSDFLELLLIDVLNGMDIGVGSSPLSFGKGCHSIISNGNSVSFYMRSFTLIMDYCDISKKGVC